MEYSQFLEKGVKMTIYQHIVNSKEIDTIELGLYLGKVRVGRVVLMPNNSTKIMWIDWLEILEAFRGKKLGHLFITKIESLCKVLGFNSIRFFVDFDNEIAQKLCRKSGFDFTGDILEYCYEMEKDIGGDL
jgi:GNAT superfamily N-acetyltransferase